MTPAALLAGLLMHGVQAATPADYVAVLPISTSGESAAWQVELDSSVYAISTDPELRDVAVFNADGNAVPMIIWPIEFPAQSPAQRAAVHVLPLPARNRNSTQGDLHLIVERDASGRLRRLETHSAGQAAERPETDEWVLDLGEFEHGIDYLELDWDAPRTGIMARLEVAGSNDLQSWSALGAAATLVMIEQDGVRIERREIDLPATRLRYLRLHRTDGGAAFSGLRAIAGKTRPVPGMTRMQWLEAAAVKQIGSWSASPTRHLYTLNSSVPIADLHIDLAGDNVLAQLDVFTSADSAEAPLHWSPPARIVAFRLLQDGEAINNDALAFGPGPRVRTLRIDSATPLTTPPHLVVGYRPARILFLAEGKAPYQLAVGSAKARTPAYPVATALASLRGNLGSDWQPPSAELGEPQSSGGEQALRAPTAPADFKRWALWAILIAAAAVVGTIAINLLRRAGQGGTEDRQQPPEQ